MVPPRDLGIGGGTFDERGLPPNQVAQELFWDVRWRDDAALPDGFRIEIGLIADAYGRPGGGLQLVVKRPDLTAADGWKGVPLRDLGDLFHIEEWFAA